MSKEKDDANNEGMSSLMQQQKLRTEQNTQNKTKRTQIDLINN